MWQFVVYLVVAAACGLALNALLFRIARKRLQRAQERHGISVRKHCYPVLRLLFPLLVVLLVAPSLPLPERALLVLRRLLSILFIGLFAWLAVAGVFAGRELVLSRYDLEASDNLKARAVYTQVNVLVRILVIVIGLVAVAAALMVFDQVRQVGTSILASAGVAGIIVGFAAQRSIATLLAGLQIAITQPIRIDDVVIVEGEWGKIEEITLTYVVVCIWDLRRLVVPTSYFLQQPFQNWTRTSADLLGSVILHADYSLPVDAVREQLQAILKDEPLWDGKVWNLQVTEAGERTLQLRALMSAASASAAWDLRCAVREKLLVYLQRHYPQCLPRLRAELRGAAPGEALPAGFEASEPLR